MSRSLPERHVLLAGQGVGAVPCARDRLSILGQNRVALVRLARGALLAGGEILFRPQHFRALEEWRTSVASRSIEEAIHTSVAKNMAGRSRGYSPGWNPLGW